NSSDLFVTGDLEVDGSVSFAGPASISNTLYVSTLGKTGNVGIGTTAPGQLLELRKDTDGESILARLKNNTGGAASTNELASLEFHLGDSGGASFDSGKITVGKENDHVAVADRDSFMAFYTDLNGTLDEKVRIKSDGNVGINTTTPTTKFEVQGTASASYLLTGNTLQVGGYASAAYSRFGTSTTGYSNFITTTNDLLISGDLEVDASATFDSFVMITNTATASLDIRSGTDNEKKFTIRSNYTGTASTKDRLSIFNGDNIELLSVASSGFTSIDMLRTGPLSFEDDAGIVSWVNMEVASSSTSTIMSYSAQIDSENILTIYGLTGASNIITNKRVGVLTTDPTTILEVQGTASASYLLSANTLQVGGFASAAYSRFGTSTTGYSNFITTTNDLLISGDLEVDASAQFDSFVRISNSNTRAFAVTDTGGARNDIFVVDTTASNSNSGITITAGTTQTGALFELKSSGGTLLTKFSDEGGLDINVSSTSALLVQTSGVPDFSVDTVNGNTAVWNGAFCVDNDNTGCPASPTAGRLYAINATVLTDDLAEFMRSAYQLEAGDIVIPDPDFKNASPRNYEQERRTKELGTRKNIDELGVKKSEQSYQSSIVGVVSTKPGITLGGFEPTKNDYEITLSGRVPVKVSLENGSIKEGDRLTTSSIPGVAMKATKTGPTLGIALEPLASASFDFSTPNSYGKIMILMDLSYWLPSPDTAGDPDSEILGEAGAIFDLKILFASIVKKFSEAMNIVFENGLLKVAQIFTDKITAKELCLEEVCVTKEQLKRLMQNNGGIPIATPSPSVQNQIATPTPIPTTEPSITPEPSGSASPTPATSESPTPTPPTVPEPSPSPSPLTSPTSTPEPTASPVPEPTPEQNPTPEPTVSTIPESTSESIPEPSLEPASVPEPNL
ncbi:MAG: procyclic acidic repetitive family protein, partial [Candidatus Yanofskybacteria bacterium]|nr:procyclic acidic repetitive family protein [Candidatus Yanofskybacteria bacterium]